MSDIKDQKHQYVVNEHKGSDDGVSIPLLL